MSLISATIATFTITKFRKVFPRMTEELNTTQISSNKEETETKPKKKFVGRKNQTQKVEITNEQNQITSSVRIIRLS